MLDLLLLLFPGKGVPYNVTVFATNGKGKGPDVSKVAYAEEDGNYKYIHNVYT